MRLHARHRDIILYFLIGFIPVLIATPDPVRWRGWLTATFAGLTTVKGKLSKAPDKEEEAK